MNYRLAAFQRERDKLANEIQHCSSENRFIQSQNGVNMSEHLFAPTDIQVVAAKPIKCYWGVGHDDAEILRWVKQAKFDDPLPVDVPWAWTGFVMVPSVCPEGHQVLGYEQRTTLVPRH